MLYYNVTNSIAIPAMRFLPFLLCLLPIVTQAEISVVTSIRPLYQITAALMQDVATPKLLIKHSTSAHHFALKPSHFRILQKADLVIWIDRHFESGFQRLPEILPKNARQLELLPAIGLDKQDGHIWYSPNLLVEISNQITRVLSELDNPNRGIYLNNNRKFQQSIILWKQEVELVVSENKPRYILDHDFLTYFEAAFGVKAVAVIHDNHDQHGGIKALKLIEQKLNNHSANCLISNEATISRVGKNLMHQFSLSSHSIQSFSNDSNLATQFSRHLQQFTEILRGC